MTDQTYSLLENESLQFLNTSDMNNSLFEITKKPSNENRYFQGSNVSKNKLPQEIVDFSQRNIKVYLILTIFLT